MSVRARICLIAVGLILLHLSCARLQEELPTGEGDIVLEELPHTDSIPLSWGKLISVSSALNIPNWVQLWFQDEEGNVRMVPYSVRENRLATQARLIRRR